MSRSLINAHKRLVMRRRALLSQRRIRLKTKKRFQDNGRYILLNLLDELLNNAPLDIVQLIGHVSSTLYTNVNMYLMRRVHRTLRPWIKNPKSFRRAMGHSRSIVGGSVVLDTVLNNSWHPEDLNVFCPRGQAAKMATYLVREEHYYVDECVKPSDPLPIPPSTPIPTPIDVMEGVNIIIKLRNPRGKRIVSKISVIESRDGYALSPIVQAPSTLTMNWITSDTLSVAYPRYTLRHEAVARMTSSKDFMAWSQKYGKRGFRWIGRGEWRKGRNEAGSHGASCPGLLRRSDDGVCLTMSFASRGNDTENGSHWCRSQYPCRAWTILGTSSLSCCHMSTCPTYRLQTAYELGQMFLRHYYTEIVRMGGDIWIE